MLCEKMKKWQTENWMSEFLIENIEYSEYWNDEEKEQKKEWYILNGNFKKMEQYLKSTGLPKNLKTCLEVLKTDFKRKLGGLGIDLGAGNLWAARYLFDLCDVDKLYCLEFSKHRLLKLGPAVLDHYDIPHHKVVLALGSFYELKLDDKSMDFVFMSQSFHHAEDPNRLLLEIHRVLKPEGIVIIIGEHNVNYYKEQAKHVLKYLISVFMPEKIQKKIFNKTYKIEKMIATADELFSPDSITGDHYYSIDEYRSMFSKYGFRIRIVRNLGAKFQSFILVRT